ncbi:DUF3861 family protein, partial [Acinetobacter pittii]|uniref:DUF3861 family protein n=1 Tax=Acinetobacter pittii TaxID=48296 RepID=UPI0025AFCC85
MKQHQYHVTVQHLKNAKGEASTYTERLEFYAGNHDDIFEIVERLKKADFFDDETALLHKDLKVKTSHIYSNLSDNSGM